ncbi:MAG: hypothetical protein EPN20_09465 [Magnetospirillum sp.]|nr:MAG: hypothetical protein EPN20_09465 [Magnetospirillum sp.]
MAARLENGDYLAIGTADERYVIPGDVFPTIYDAVGAAPAVSGDIPEVADTHEVTIGGEVVFTGSRDGCQTWADNHIPSGGYGIGPIFSET